MLENFDQLLKKAKDGDDSAFGQIYKSFAPPLEKFLYLRSKSNYEELASDTWTGVVLKLKEFNGNEIQFRAWLYTIARNRMIDYFRKNNTVPFDPTIESFENLAGQNYAEDPTVADENLREINKFIRANLKTLEYEVVLLRVVSDLSVSEVAKIFKKPESAIRVIQHRALKKLSRMVVIKSPPED